MMSGLSSSVSGAVEDDACELTKWILLLCWNSLSRDFSTLLEWFGNISYSSICLILDL